MCASSLKKIAHSVQVLLHHLYTLFLRFLLSLQVLLLEGRKEENSIYRWCNRTWTRCTILWRFFSLKVSCTFLMKYLDHFHANFPNKLSIQNVRSGISHIIHFQCDFYRLKYFILLSKMILWVSESRPDVSIPPSVIVLGMAGSGKTSFVQVNAEKMKKKWCIWLFQRLTTHLHANKTPPYVINLDPACNKVCTSSK